MGTWYSRGTSQQGMPWEAAHHIMFKILLLSIDRKAMGNIHPKPATKGMRKPLLISMLSPSLGWRLLPSHCGNALELEYCLLAHKCPPVPVAKERKVRTSACLRLGGAKRIRGRTATTAGPLHTWMRLGGAERIQEGLSLQSALCTLGCTHAMSHHLLNRLVRFSKENKYL